MSLLKPLEAAQQGIGATAVGELNRVERLPVFVELADISGFLASRAHKDHSVGVVVIRQRAILYRAGLALPAIARGVAHLADHGPVIVTRGEIQIGLVFGGIGDTGPRSSAPVEVHDKVGGYDADDQSSTDETKDVRICFGFEANADYRRG